MKRLYLIIMLVAVSVSCQKNEITQTGKGHLCMTLSVDAATRSVLTEGDVSETAVVNIYKADFSGLVRSYEYSSLPEAVYLAAASYRVDVIAGDMVSDDPAVASWDRKSYKGSTMFDIVSGRTTEVEVIANLNNAVTRIFFDETIEENFAPGYTFTIGLDPTDEQTNLTYEASDSGADGYFLINGLDEPSFTWRFDGVLAKNGVPFTKTGTISGLLQGKLYKMNVVYTVRNGEFDFSIHVDPMVDEIDDTVVFEPVSTGLAESYPYEIWAAHATIHADIDASESEGATVQFAYSSDGITWEKVDGVQESEASWKAELTGLTPSTEYAYRLLINDVTVGDDLTLTTDSAPKIPNGSFEYVSKVTGANYYKFYDPDCNEEDGSYMFWGSGNGEGPDGVNGSANMDIIITDIDKNDKVHGQQSVCAQTSEMVGILAAGNLFTGQFHGLVGTEGGMVNFGRPWTSRPSALKLYCKYTTGKIDIIKNTPSGVSLSKNDYDRAQIQFAIGTWNHKTYGGTKESPVHINTTKSNTFINYYTDSSTIANGDLIIHHDGYILNKGAKVTASTSGWVEYTIPLIYRNLTTYPTHIVVSCAASQYGDYFTGCSTSKLWIDAVELIYE